jgi:hypothetical protein
MRIDRCPGPSFARSANPQPKSFPVPATLPGFDCPTHGRFKVADTIATEECTRQRWEAALRKAKLRAKPWEVPLVMSEDLFW